MSGLRDQPLPTAVLDGDDGRAADHGRSTGAHGRGERTRAPGEPARRQWIAAGLVLAAIPAGVAAGIVDSDLVAAWVLAGSGRSPPSCSSPGRPSRGVAAPPWRLSAWGWGSGAAPSPPSPRATTTACHAVPIPSAADVPLLVGLSLVGVAAVLMALRPDRGRQHRADRRGHRRRRRRRGPRRLPLARAARGGPQADAVAVGIAAGVRRVLPRRRGGAPGDHGRLTPGRGPVHHRGRARARRGLVLLRTSPVRPHRRTTPGRHRRWRLRGRRVVLAGRRRAPVGVPDQRARAASRARPSATCGSPCSRWPPRRDRSAPSSSTSEASRSTDSCSAVSPRCCSSRGRAARAGRALEPGTGASRGHGPRRRRAIGSSPGRAGDPCGRDRGRPTSSGRALRYVAWIAVNERGAIYPTELVGPHGPIDRTDSTVDERPPTDRRDRRPPGAARRRHGRRGGPRRRSHAASAPAPGSRWPRGRVPDEVDESLAILGTQAALALDALVQSEELHEKRSEARFQQLVRHSSDAVLIVGRDGRIRYQTPSVVRVLGLPRRRPRRRRLRPGAPPRRRRPRAGVPRAAGPRRRPRRCAPSTLGSCGPTTR